MSPQPELRTVDRTLQLLGIFADHPERTWTLADLSRQAGFHKTTTLRMLATLERRGYVQRDAGDGSYTLGPAALALGTAPQSRLRRVAHAELQRLTAATGETSLLHIRARTQAVCIDKVDSTEPIRVTYDIGQSGPLYAGSSGKALLAFLDPTEQEQVLNEIEFVAFTPLTVTDRRELERNLASVRGQGYAHTFGELDNGVQAVGAPIWNHLNRLEGGVTLVGPATRWTTERVPAFVQATVASAARISSLLGHRELPSEFAAEPALPV